MTKSDEVTTHQVVGTWKGIMQVRGEWEEFHIDIGRQYPVKLSTKKDEIKAAAHAAEGQEAVWTYTERDGNENPHQAGTYFKNRYLSSVEVGGTADPALTGASSGSNAPQGAGNEGGRMPSSDDRGQSIERQVIVKAIAPLWGSTGLTDVEAFFSLLDRLDDWMGRNRTQPDTPEAAEAQPEPSADDGDDIPF